MRALVSSVLVAGCTPQPEVPEEPAPVAASPTDLSSLLEPLLADSPAIGAAIGDRDAVLAIGAVGVRNAEKNRAVTVDDRWHLGSDTKAMTATLAATFILLGGTNSGGTKVPGQFVPPGRNELGRERRVRATRPAAPRLEPDPLIIRPIASLKRAP